MREVERRWLQLKAHARKRRDRAQSELHTRIGKALAGVAVEEAVQNQHVRELTMATIIEFLAGYEDRFAAGLLQAYLCSDDPTELDRVQVNHQNGRKRRGGRLH